MNTKIIDNKEKRRFELWKYVSENEMEEMLAYANYNFLADPKSKEAIPESYLLKCFRARYQLTYGKTEDGKDGNKMLTS